VAAGWAVEDDAANRFAVSFYEALLRGDRFMDAVQAGRVAAYEASPQGNTWAAYQCYGDPEWVWQPDSRDANRTAPALGQEFIGIASPVALTLALETLAVESTTQGANAATQRERIHFLEARFSDRWGGMGAVAEAFGVACAAASDTERAVHWFAQAVAANDGSASVKSSEQLANLRARMAWDRLQAALHTKTKAAEQDALIRQGRDDIRSALNILEALVTVAPTIERESLLGSACKRLAMLEGVAGQRAAEAAAIAHMAEHYGKALTLATQQTHPQLFYPGLNLLAAELLAHRQARNWGGFDSEPVQHVRESLERKRREDPDFWSVVGLPELGVYEALADRQLAARLPRILQAFDDLHNRAGTPWLWASVADQLDFVLSRFNAGTGAEAAAAQELTEVLRRYAQRP
jgi:hypothetical protein